MYCTQQLGELKGLLDMEGRKGAELLAVSVDSRDLLQTMADKISAEGTKADFLFLSDSGHRVIDRYGLLNPEGRGWAHPTVFVIDRRGIVRWKFIEINYKVRPTNEMILKALAAVDVGVR
jgi:peroxiredoxin